MSSTDSTPHHVRTEIAVWMRRRELTQDELAAKIGVGQSWVSKRLTGKVSISVDDLESFALALGVPAAEFFRDTASGGSTNYRSATA